MSLRSYRLATIGETGEPSLFHGLAGKIIPCRGGWGQKSQKVETSLYIFHVFNQNQFGNGKALFTHTISHSCRDYPGNFAKF